MKGMNPKLIIAVLLIVAAGALLIYYYGIKRTNKGIGITNERGDPSIPVQEEVPSDTTAPATNP